MIDEKLIKDIKSVYGDNFECIAEAWSKLVGYKVDGAMVALMMSEMKQCRIDAIDLQLSKFPPPDVGLKLYSAREDSFTDKANYKWIANNYADYKAL